MTISGSGVGGNIGGPLQPSQLEMEQTAATTVAHLALGLIKDTVEVPFTQLGGNIWKYQSSANTPTLPPLFSERTTSASADPTQPSWPSAYDALTNMLPPAISSALLQQMQLPSDARDPALSSLNNLLVLTAKTFAGQTDVSTGSDEIASLKNLINMALPFNTLNGMAQETPTLVNGGSTFLTAAGGNYSFRDQASYFLRQMGTIGDDLAALSSKFQTQDPTLADKLPLIHSNVQQVSAEFTRLFASADLQILGTMFQQMVPLTASLELALASPGAASLLLGISMASTGINSNSQTGFMGETLTALSSSLTTGAFQLLASGSATSSAALYLSHLGQVLTIAALALPTLLEAAAMPAFPQLDANQTDNAKNFSFNIALRLLTSLDAVPQLLNPLLNPLGLSDTKQQQLVEVMQAGILSLMILSTVKGSDPEKAAPLLNDLQSRIQPGLEIAANALIDSSTQDSPTTLAGIALQQTSVALQQGNAEEAIRFLFGAFAELGWTQQNLMNDAAATQSVALSVQSNLSAIDDKTNKMTGMSIAA